ncbi:5'-methylthioadenosine/S-adenosylhomocysteine nucleosidase, partial [Roseburia faecis]
MKIGIIGAMEEEVSILRGQIEHPHVETIAGYEYTAGKMKGKDVILLRSGIGKVNAALSTGLLLQT